MAGSLDLAVSTASPRCPRCHYDLRGTVATWTESCPLEGVCNECGLAFEWVEVFRPGLRGEHWNIEREPLKRRLILAAGRTWLRSFIPWSFWSRLMMSHPIRSDRLAYYLVLLGLSLLLLYPVIQVTGAVIVRYRQGQILPRSIANTSALVGYLQSLQQLGAADLRTRNFHDELSPAMRQYLAALDDAQRSQVLALQRRSLASLQTMSLNVSYADAIFEALVFPARTTSRHASLGGPYTPPAYLYEEIIADLQVQGTMGPGGTTWKWYGGYSWGHRLHDVALMILPLLIFALLMPLGLAALPMSRHKARVRWQHIARVAAYSMFTLHVFAAGSILCIWISYLSGSQPQPEVLAFAAPGAVVLMLVVHWAVAIKRYLRMPHGAAISVALAVLAALIMAVGVNV